MSELTTEQIKEVSEVINRYSKPRSTEELQQEEKRRQKLIAFLKSEDSGEETIKKSLW